MDNEESRKQALSTDINSLMILASSTNIDPLSEYNRNVANWPPHAFSQRFTVQDAISTILQDGRPKELYSVALQIDKDRIVENRAVILYISTNQQVNSAKTRYLEEVYTLLQDRARSWGQYNREKRLYENQTDTEIVENPMKPPVMPPDIYHTLIRRVHRQCFNRWFRWMHEARGAISRFKISMLAAVAKIANPYAPENWWIRSLTNIIDQYDWAYEYTDILARQGLDTMDVISHVDFASKMSSSSGSYCALEGCPDVVDIIEGWHALSGDETESITHHLRRFVEIQFSIDCLVRVTQSAKTAHWFQHYPVEIVFIDRFVNLPTPIRLPDDIQGWEAVLHKALNAEGFVIHPDRREAVRNHLQVLCPVSSQHNAHPKVTLHPMMQLLQFFVSFNIRPPILPNIGSSAPICSGCSAVFAAWDAFFYSPRFVARGSKGKYAWPWSAPTEWVGSRMETSCGLLRMIYKTTAERVGSALYEAGIVVWAEDLSSSGDDDKLDGEDGEDGEAGEDGENGDEPMDDGHEDSEKHDTDKVNEDEPMDDGHEHGEKHETDKVDEDEPIVDGHEDGEKHETDKVNEDEPMDDGHEHVEKHETDKVDDDEPIVNGHEDGEKRGTGKVGEDEPMDDGIKDGGNHAADKDGEEDGDDMMEDGHKDGEEHDGDKYDEETDEKTDEANEVED